MAGEMEKLLGIFPASADSSATTSVKEAQAAKENSNGQAQATERGAELQDQSNRPVALLAHVRRFAEGDIPALQRMLAHVGSAYMVANPANLQPPEGRAKPLAPFARIG